MGVSTDSEHSHKTWIEGNLGKLNHPLASDKTRKASEDYGVLIEEDGIALRGLFIIDPDGIARYGVYQDLNIGRNVDEIIRVLKGLQTGGLVPANWEEGDELL